jgi:hypothetical protein
MPNRDPKAATVENRLLKGSAAARRLVASSAALMGTREVLHAEMVMGKKSGEEARIFKSLINVNDQKTIFQRCRRLAGTKGFIEWVLRAKKLLFHDGFRIEGVENDEDRAQLARAVRDMWTELLVQNNVVSVWRGADEKAPLIQVADCEGVKYEDDFGEETLRICYDSRAVSETQKAKLGERYTKALSGEEIVWGEGAGEGFKVLKSAKMGGGLGNPSLYAIFEEIAIHGLLTIGDWNAAWTTKDVLRQFKKGHQITQGNMAGLPVHFLKITERDAIHKSMKDKAGAVDIVTNFDVEVEYPGFDFGFFKNEKYEAVRQRLMDWSGPVGLIYLGGAHRDPETDLELLRVEMESAREAIRRHFGQIIASEQFSTVKEAKLVWNQFTMLGWERLVKYITMALSNGLMPPPMARQYLGIDEKEANRLMEEARKKPENYTPIFEQKQGMAAIGEPPPLPPDPTTGGRPPTAPP